MQINLIYQGAIISIYFNIYYIFEYKIILILITWRIRYFQRVRKIQWAVLRNEHLFLLALFASKPLSYSLTQCYWLTIKPLICIFLHFPLLIRYFSTTTNRRSHFQVLSTSVIWQAHGPCSYRTVSVLL